MRCALSLLVLLCLPVSVLHAQNSTRIILTSSPDASIQEEVERNTTAVLTSINYAYRHKQLPIIPKWAITSAGERSIISLWRDVPFYCPFTEIEVSLVRSVEQGFSMRNIRLFLSTTDEQGDHLDREAYFELNPEGQINLFGFVAEE